MRWKWRRQRWHQLALEASVDVSLNESIGRLHLTIVSHVASAALAAAFTHATRLDVVAMPRDSPCDVGVALASQYEAEAHAT